jgi:nucleotide-binding universal stress UspA family protein
MKNILVPTDFSETAELAADLGIELSKKLNCEITFLHLINTPVEWSNLPLEKEKLYPETKEAIGDAKDKLNKLAHKAENQGVDANTSLIYNLGIGELNKYISKENHYLVIIGSHGQKGRKKAVGSHTLQVTRSRSPVPVITMKSGEDIQVPQKWVILSDFFEKSGESFTWIMSMAKDLGASVQLLYINTPYFFAETSEINEKLNRLTAPYPDMDIKHVTINAHNEERGMEAYINSCDCDLVSVITHSRSGLNPVFRSSITEKILNHVNLPVMNINADI